MFSLQEPLSAVLSAFNLLMHFIGWLTFFILLHYKLPVRPQSRRTYYEYSGLWHIYGVLSMNAWFWSAIFHTRYVTKLISQIWLCQPLTHICFPLFSNLFWYLAGWNMKVCLLMGVSQLLMWAIWGGVTRHPSRFKLWAVVFGCALAMLLEIYDFPPFHGYADAHALWHATTIPLTYLWWSFIKDDAKFRTSAVVKKVK
ncbi:hypothetical protein BHE74_00029917 [Ensete ventricosum]|uniref:Post-GPI attachment to proteins factor 3 n=1 Tax=Ensete ventricosum TaxID=4639 RepID=A0A444DYP1_ENSVE|nr:hypothetical protein GW17_00033640 [Ensete ventricosum]RWW62957.1 hypothetical protein BHE74_00029917 [Ensete ventricosum]RZR74417.1 hypothetical protein BHM03_00036734 [Ensete ventricosum]